MLRPRDTSTRERKNLNGLWQFALDQAGEGRSDQWFARPLPGAREMAVPASFNDIAADAAVRDYFGDIWYQTSIWIPRGWQGRRIVLHFESATHRATVWVNDNEVVSRADTPLRGRHHRARDRRRASPDHRCSQQHAELPVHPTRRHRGHACRKASDLLARLLQLCGNPADRLVVLDRCSARH